MKVIKSQDGKHIWNPKHVRSAWVERSQDGVMLRIRAEVQGGRVVTLREVNSYELVGAEDYIARQFEIIEEAMNYG